MDVATLWISGIAIVVSVGTAISQVILWRLSGPNLKVKVSTATLVGEVMRSAVVVRVTNDGRAPTRLRLGVVKAIPVVGAVLSGGLTLGTFLPMSKRLQKHLASLELTKPGHRPEEAEIIDSEVIN